MRTNIATVAFALALVACGQGDSSLVPVPDPSPPPTPMPTPTPACPSAEATSTQTFDSATSIIQYDFTNSASVRKIVAPVFDRALGFTPTTQTYTYRVTSDLLDPNVPESASIAAATHSPPSSSASSNANFEVFSVGCPQIDRTTISATLRLFDTRVGSNQLQLNHTGFGSYTYTSSQGSVIGPASLNDFRAIGYGAQSQRAALPQTGTKTFTGALSGLAAQDNVGPSDVFRVLGSFVISVDFATGTISGSVTPLFDPAEANPNRSPVSFDIYPIITDSSEALPRFSGHFANGGKIAGFVSGPSADELAISIQLPTTRLVSNIPKTTTIIASGAGRQ